jgi:hypothetical protein
MSFKKKISVFKHTLDSYLHTSINMAEEISTMLLFICTLYYEQEYYAS